MWLIVFSKKNKNSSSWDRKVACSNLVNMSTLFNYNIYNWTTEFEVPLKTNDFLKSLRLEVPWPLLYSPNLIDNPTLWFLSPPLVFRWEKKKRINNSIFSPSLIILPVKLEPSLSEVKQNKLWTSFWKAVALKIQ